MAGYRPDDDWAVTTESDEPMSGGWKVIVAFFGIFVPVIVVGELAHVPLWLFVGTALAVATFLVWQVIYCLRMGVVGVRFGGDAHRDNQPIAYWMGIAMLAFAASFSIYVVWILMT
jgi:hypothetical protein